MKRTSVTDTIQYLEPEDNQKNNGCAGVLLGSRPKTLIDGQMGFDRESIEDTIQLLGVEKPDRAFITHYHLDHSQTGYLVRRHSDAELFLPEGEEQYLTDFDYFVRNTAGGSGSCGCVPEWRLMTKEAFHYLEIDDFHIYRDLDTFKSGQTTIKCIRTPGHSLAHTSFYFPREKILFTGDMGLDRFGPWYGWPDSDLAEMIESILRLRSLKVETLLTSHSGIITSNIGQAWDRCIEIIMQREQWIRSRLDQGDTKKEIVEQGIFFKNKTGVPEPQQSFLLMWDSNMFDKHRSMLDQGSLERLFPGLHAPSKDHGRNHL